MKKILRKLKTGLRHIRIQQGKMVLDRKSTRVPLEFARIKKILFLRQDGKIGDYIVSSFVFREIKKQRPDIQIGLICSAQNRAMFAENPYIDQLYQVKQKNIGDYLRVAQQLRAEHYDVVIDPTVVLRNRDLLLLNRIRADYYVGYDKADYRIFNLPLAKANLHFAEIYAQALQRLGFAAPDTHYDVPCEATSQSEIGLFLQEQQLDHYIALNFFGAASRRCFSAAAMRTFLQHLRAKTAKKIVLLTYPAVNEKLLPLLNEFTELYFYQQTRTIYHTIELIRHADLVITPDTSIVHIANGLDKSLIAFYQQDDSAQTAENLANWGARQGGTAPVQLLFFREHIDEITQQDIPAQWLRD